MRIGVYTHRLHLNYGGILQAYALQRVLQDMGHDAVYIEWYPYDFRLAPLKIYLWRFLLKLFRNREVIVFREWVYRKCYCKINEFTENNISILTIKDLHEEDVDVLIVGSDQVWRALFFPEGIEKFYLDFAKDWDVRRIAYAASFGVADWSEYSDEQTVVCRNLAQKFDAVSVREDSGVELCRNYLGVDAVHVLDPTMLVDIKHYICHINSCKKRYPERMCLAYILDEADDKLAVLNSIAKYQGYNVQQWKNATPNIKNPTVEEWLKGFHDAEFVFTDSFHGCVFSIIFNKPFIAFGNEGRGMARFDSLLKMFGLEELLITSSDQFTPELVDRAILRFSDNSIQQRLNELRRESYEFLKSALEGIK